ncbi:E3 ubiquitin-protein ligase rnf152-like [Arapaima gigas]
MVTERVLPMAEIPGSVPVIGQEDPGGGGGPAEVECPICYHEYNQEGKCPRMLQCLHVFCTECLQRIRLSAPHTVDACGSPAILCPLCRHPTPLAAGDTLSLPCNSRILARLPPMAFCVPTPATVTQQVVLSLESCDSRFIILPTVSLRVEQMSTAEGSTLSAASLDGDRLPTNQRTLLCIQLLAITLWVLFVMTCVVGVVFGPKFFNN